jgi:hypothetical protein
MGRNINGFRNEHNCENGDDGEILERPGLGSLALRFLSADLAVIVNQLPLEILIGLSKALTEKGSENHAEYPACSLWELVRKI